MGLKLLGTARALVASIRFTAFATPRQLSDTPDPQGISDVIRKSAGRDVGSGKTYPPRLRVHTESVVEPRSICISQIMAWGRPFSNRCQTGDAALMLLV